MVYVINSNGHPLMPTERHGKVRRLLRDGLARVVNRSPFTIQLLYEADENMQSFLTVPENSDTIPLLSCPQSEIAGEQKEKAE